MLHLGQGVMGPHVPRAFPGLVNQNLLVSQAAAPFGFADPGFADFTLAFPNSLGPQLLPYTWEGVWGLEDSPCLPRCIFNAVP